VINFKTCLFLTLGLLLSGSIFAQQMPVYQPIQLADHIYELAATGGITLKVIVSVGEDGILMVDAGQKKGAEEMQKAVLALRNETPKFIINTHGHVEHIGGNYIFGKEPIIIGHKNLRNSMRSGSYLFEEFGDESLPDISFADSMSLYFNGEEIKLYALSGAHDDDDIIVWFTKSKVVCVGGLSNGHHFPTIEQIAGNSTKFAEISSRIVALLPDDVKIIPGHGKDGTMADYRVFNDMCIKTADIVRNELAKGKDLATLQKEDVLKDYQSFEGSYIDRNGWIQMLVNDIQNPDQSGRVNIFPPIYYALQEKGADSAIAVFNSLRMSEPDNPFFESALSFIVLKLFTSNKFQESLKFAELAVKDFPKSEVAYLHYYYVARNYQKLGNKELAIKNFKKSLKLNADNPKAVGFLKELEGK
jgi:cyclase